MNFSKISKVLFSFAFLGAFACGIISAQEPASSEVVESVANPADEKATGATSSVNASNEKNDIACKDMGSFTLNSTLVKQTSHFGLFKDENGSLLVKDITDDNKDDKSKKGDCKSYKVTYTCCVCYYPSCEENEGKVASESDVSRKEDEVKSDSTASARVDSSEEVKSSEQ